MECLEAASRLMNELAGADQPWVRAKRSRSGRYIIADQVGRYASSSVMLVKRHEGTAKRRLRRILN